MEDKYEEAKIPGVKKNLSLLIHQNIKKKGIVSVKLVEKKEK